MGRNGRNGPEPRARVRVLKPFGQVEHDPKASVRLHRMAGGHDRRNTPKQVLAREVLTRVESEGDREGDTRTVDAVALPRSPATKPLRQGQSIAGTC